MPTAGAPAGAPAVRLVDVGLQYGDRDVLQHVSFEVELGGSLALMGTSGSGKTSILSIVLGLLRPDTGAAWIGSTCMTTAGHKVATGLRRNSIGVVFQSGELLEDLTPTENVMLTGMLSGQEASKARAEAADWLSMLGVPTTVKRTSDLSGGEQQRVAVARALMGSPAVLVADEPTAALDSETRDQIADVIFGLPERTGAALLIATHDREVANRAERVIRIGQSR